MRELIRHILREHTSEIGEGAPKVTFNQFLNRAREVHGDKYDYDESSFKGMSKNMKIICPNHGEFEQTPKNHTLQKQQCPKCSGRYKNTKEDFIKLSKQKFGDRYDYSLVDYENTEEPVKIICPVHGEFSQTPYHHIHSKTGCPFCGGTAKQNTKLFIDRAKKIHGDKFDYSKVDYTKGHSKVKIICPVHGEFEQTAKSHLAGVGCSKCSGKSKHTNETFVEKSKEIHGEKYDYSKVNYKNAYSPVIITCKKHGDFPQKPNNHLNGAGCPTCNESKGENLINFILTNLGIEFLRQHKFVDCTNTLKGRKCRRLPFDFYLPNKNITIEFDGQQHYIPVWGTKGFERIKFTDNLKSQYCEKNNIKLIRIPYTMSPEEIETYLLMELGLTD